MLAPKTISVEINHDEKGLYAVPTFRSTNSHALKIPRGNAVNFRVAIFNGETPADISNITSINLRVQPSRTQNAPLIDQSATNADASWSATLNKFDWQDGTAQHAQISLTGAQTNIDLGGKELKECYVVVTAFGIDDQSNPFELTLASDVLYLVEDNNAAADPPPENPGTAATLTDLAALNASLVTQFDQTLADTEAARDAAQATDIGTLEPRVTTLENTAVQHNGVGVVAADTEFVGALRATGNTLADPDEVPNVAQADVRYVRPTRGIDYFDDFIRTNYTSGMVGDLGWVTNAVSGELSHISYTTGYAGTLRVSPNLGNTIKNTLNLGLYNLTHASVYKFVLKAGFRVHSTTGSGFIGFATLSDSKRVGLYYDLAVSANFIARTNNGTTVIDVDTGVPVAAGYYQMRMTTINGANAARLDIFNQPTSNTVPTLLGGANYTIIDIGLPPVPSFSCTSPASGTKGELWIDYIHVYSDAYKLNKARSI